MSSDLEQDPTENEQAEQGTTELGDRWSTILAEVHESHKSTQPWYQRLGITLAWSAGIGFSMAIVVLLLLVIVNLFTKENLLTARDASNWLFYGSALLLLAGLVAPTATGEEDDSNTSRSDARTEAASTQRPSGRQGANVDDRKLVRTFEERQARAMRKRLLQVYNPWRWRLWLSFAFCFSLSMLVWVLS